MTLHYEFPADITLDEVKELVKDNPNFIIVDKGDYIVANYVRAGNDTFPPVTDRDTAILRELRGLIFSPEGEVVARRFHKFFNLGEREDLMNIDVSIPHQFLEKLDGSMITPIPMPNGVIRFGTKMGITDVSMQAEEFVAKNPRYSAFVKSCIDLNITAIFEWCSRQQRIVIDYPEDKLVLIDMRKNKTGMYFDYEFMERLAVQYNIPIVMRIAQDGSFEDFVQQIKAWDGEEGVVVNFTGGHKVKVKADAYVSLHRAKSLLDNERDVVELILNDKIDDLIPLLNDEDKMRLFNFERAINKDMAAFEQNLYNILVETHNANMNKKDFALTRTDLDQVTKSFCFRNFDIRFDDMWTAVRKIAISVKGYILTHLGSNTQFEKCKVILKTAKWKVASE